MHKEIILKLPYKIVVEILKNLPQSEIQKIKKKLEKNENKKIPVFKISTSPFFSHKPVDLGDTTAEEIDKIITKQV